jgi:hypothetical protein
MNFWQIQRLVLLERPLGSGFVEVAEKFRFFSSI